MVCKDLITKTIILTQLGDTMKKLILASVVLFLTACDPFEGTLSVKEAFTVTSTDRDDVVQVTIPAGDQSAKFEFPSKKEIQIKLKINGKKKTLKLELPKKLNIPANGEFSISSTDLGQSFGAAGRAETKVTDGPIRNENEQCSYTRYETRCHVTGNGQTVCQQVPVTVWGRRWVEYQERHTDQKIAVNFGSADRVLANFSGQRAFSERLIRYEGQCW